MASPAPVYDLMLLLSTSADEDRRKQILGEVESAISNADGSIDRNDDWGTRGLTYRIAHQPDAEYHLLQFTGPPSLLESLSHSLRISDDVLRFRIIKVIPGTPPAPESPPPVVASVAASRAGGSSAAAAVGGDTEAVAAVPAEEVADAEVGTGDVATETEEPPEDGGQASGEETPGDETSGEETPGGESP